MSKPLIHVAAGLIVRQDGWLLLAQRPGDKPWSGWWELPGGKIEPGESVLQALARELDEELGIGVTKASPWVTYTHEYPKNFVHLAFCRVTGWTGEPHGVEGQKLAWVDPHAALPVGPMLPATEPPLRWLQLPDRYLISSIGSEAGLPAFMSRLNAALESGIRLVQFREPGWAASAQPQHSEQPQHPKNSVRPVDSVRRGFLQVLDVCHKYGARCLVNSCHPESWRAEADGVHWRAADAQQQAAAMANDSAQRRQSIDEGHLAPGRLNAVSAHDAADLAAARALGADFAVLGHVLQTPSHPDQPPLGWQRFAQLQESAGLPLFAIGGQSPDTFDQAWRHGAHGIAGIRHLMG